jgi:hypothetical protein
MSNIKISDLPLGTAHPSGVIPSDNQAGTATEKLTLASIRDLPHSHTVSNITDFYSEVNDILYTYDTADSITDDVVGSLDIGTARIVRLTSTGNYSVDGLEPYPDSEGDYSDIRILSNVGSFNITFLHIAALSGPQIKCASGNDYVLTPGSSITTFYDNIDECWRIG